MQYRRMGHSGLKLSEVAVGSWMTDLKGREACDTAKEVLRRAYDSGVNFLTVPTLTAAVRRRFS